jgi:hypothetical protein
MVYRIPDREELAELEDRWRLSWSDRERMDGSYTQKG